MQTMLADLVRNEAGKSGEPSTLYELMMSGLMNRYTRNRIPFLRPVVEDARSAIGPNVTAYRYCDSVAYFIGTITDEFPLLIWSSLPQLAEGQVFSRRWFAENSDQLQLAQRIAPRMRYGVRQGDGPAEEDLSKMRR